MSPLTLRAARADQHGALSALAQHAKAHWGYPGDALARWRADLTVTRASITAMPTVVAERDGVVLGFYQLSLDGTRAELEHLWVRPDHIGRGIGRTLLMRALDHSAAAGYGTLHIDADPHAERFYRACGALRVGAVPAPIEGEPQRVRPQMALAVLRRDAGAAPSR